MKTPVFILLFLLLSSLSPAKDAGAEARMPADVGRVAECYSVASLYADCFATETVQPAVPSPVRALRKHLENHRRTTVDVRNSCFGRHFSLVRSCCTQYVVSLLSQSELTALPSHRTDYLRFGILVISPLIPSAESVPCTPQGMLYG